MYAYFAQKVTKYLLTHRVIITLKINKILTNSDYNQLFMAIVKTYIQRIKQHRNRIFLGIK